MKGKDIRDCEKVNGVWRVAANGHLTTIKQKRNHFWPVFFAIFMLPLVCVVMADILYNVVMALAGVPPMK